MIKSTISNKLRIITFLCIMAFLMITLQSCMNFIKTNSNESNPQSGISFSESESENKKAIANILNKNDLDEDIRAILQSDKASPPVTAFELIDQDLGSGILEREDAIWLKLTASFSPDKLPKKYLGAPTDESTPDSDELRRDIQWLINNFDQFDSAAKEKFKPFILKPDVAESFFNPANAEKRGSLLRNLFSAQTVYADEQLWDTLDFTAPGKPVAGTIFYQENVLTADGIPMKQKAIAAKEALEKAWPLFKGLLKKEPVKQLAFYLTDLQMAISHKAGAAYYLQDKNKVLLSFHINVDWSLSGNTLKSVSVHELFHIFQYVTMTEYEETEAYWLQEATAVWAENYIYPQVNREHKYLDLFFGSLEDRLIKIEGSSSYAGYMLFFFFSEYLKDDSIPADIILKTKGYNVADYIMNSVKDYPETFARFALWNWNAKPWKMYSDKGSFPDKKPYGTAVEKAVLDDISVKEDSISLAPGAIGYKYYHVADSEIKKIKFDFTGVAWDGKLRVQALYKVGDKWLLKDCTEMNSVIFCRNKPAENVKGVILVFSNANLKGAQELDYEVDTTGECPKTISGHTRITETMTYRNGNTSASMNINYYSDDELQYDDSRKSYVITRRSISYSLSSDKDFPDTAVIGLGGNATSGSGALLETYSLDDAPVRFTPDDDGGGQLIPDPDTIGKSWVDYNDTVLGAYKDSPLSVMMFYMTATGGIDVEPDEYNKKALKGTRTNSVSVDSKMSMETSIEFDYIMD